MRARYPASPASLTAARSSEVLFGVPVSAPPKLSSAESLKSPEPGISRSFFHCSLWIDEGHLSYPEQETVLCLLGLNRFYHVCLIACVMLFAVEGGGFLSSSASGYSSGLALLLFGQKNEDRNIKVSPWNQYQLVHQEVNHAQLASRKNQVPQGCSSFTCFGCLSSCDEQSLNPNLGASYNHSKSSTESSSDQAKVTVSVSADENERKVWLKSSLKKPSTNCCVILSEDDDARNSSDEVQTNISCFNGRRKVQWSDTCGKELTEIREFELSDDGISDDEMEHKHARSCECVIQ